MDTLHLGFFKDFKESDTILISGPRGQLVQLASLLRKLERPDSVSLEIHSLDFVTVHGGVLLIAYPSGHNEGMRRSPLENGTKKFDWCVGPEGWVEAAEKIEAVGKRGGGGHAYLDTIGDANDAVVMVSTGEYSDEWWNR